MSHYHARYKSEEISPADADADADADGGGDKTGHSVAALFCTLLYKFGNI